MGSRRKSWLVQGLAYALCGILTIMFSVEVLPRVLIDMRTPVIAVAVITGGPVVGIITVLPLLAYRIYLGGTGMNAGIGIIVTAYAFGMLLRAFERRPVGYIFQLIAGIGSAMVYYIWILTLPGGIAMTVLEETFIPLTVASILSIMAIFLIRRRETAHLELVNRLREVSDLFEEISLDENIGITVLNGGKILHINQSLLNKFGFREFDPDNSDLFAIVSPKHRTRISEFLDRVRSGEQIDALPMEVSLPGMDSLSLLVHARTLVYRGIDSVLVVSVDLTRLVNAEKALQRQVEQLQLSLDASGAVLWKADISRDALEAGKDFFDLLQYNPEENPPLFSNFIGNMEMSPEMESSFDGLQKGLVQSLFGEISFRSSDSRTRWFNASARITDRNKNGTPLEITGILYETTVIKEKELYLMEKEIEDLQSQKMETIGRLAGGVAHDFNNLLHVIMGYTEILKKVSENDPVTGELAKPILAASQKGRELVRQLLLFSRNKTPELRSTDLADVTGNFLKLLKRIIEENIVISTDIPEELPEIMGDASQIEQVLMNLCINSRDAMPAGGNIEISLCEYLCLSPEKLLTGILRIGRYVVLGVKDTGPGIHPDKHRMIFEPFYTTKQIDKGTGLGLATVQGIVESHGGVIHADNTPEGGFEITLFFPVSAGASAEASPGEAVISREVVELGSVTVLVAEDDPQVRNLTVEGLAAAGIRVLKASNGKEAVDLFRASPEKIDLLVFDVVMPGLSGPDAFREITASGYSLPVVFTTGYAGDRLSGLPGEFRMISKPYAISELIDIIRDLFRCRKGDGNDV